MAREPFLSPDAAALIVCWDCGVPLTDISLCEEQAGKAMKLADASCLPIVDFRGFDRGGLTDADWPAIHKKIKETGRSALLISGGLLEGAVTFTTIKALLEGYDVFLLPDVICASEAQRGDQMLSRLTAAGAWAVTYKQALLELYFHAHDPEIRESLEQMLRHGPFSIAVEA